jgi:cytoskeletal protein RodZ
VTSWLKAKFGRMRVSTLVLIVAFVALLWVYHNFEPRPAAPETPATAVVPPGFVPDPNYTWVPRTNVRRPREPLTTTTTTPTTTSPTTTTSPETTTPTSPTETTPTTTVVDPDGPGPLAPQTITPSPTPTPAIPPAPAPGPALTPSAPLG